MKGGLARLLATALAAAGLALLLIAGGAALLLFESGRDPTLLGAGLLLCLLLGGFALWHAWGLAAQHGRALERLRGAVVTLAGNESAVLPQLPPGETDADVARLHGALGELSAREAALRAAPDRRMEAVLGAVSEPIVVITEQGQITLVNAPARALLGPERVRVGTSVYAALSRTALADAMAKVGETAGPVPVELYNVESEGLAATATRLGNHGGFVLAFGAHPLPHDGVLEHDLTLHDRPPAPLPVTDDCPLAELPVVVLDTETTGLDVTQDRVISIGAVRLAGARVYRSVTFDRLVDPGRPIPPRSTAVHGITDAMVAGAANFTAVHGELAPLLEGCVLVGHNVAFDLAMLRREYTLAGLAWPDPPALDTLLLTCALDPALPSFELDALAQGLGLQVHGRHTALGDALATAEVYVRLLPRLADAGIATFGEAQAHSAKARHFVKKQKEQGW